MILSLTSIQIEDRGDTPTLQKTLDACHRAAAVLALEEIGRSREAISHEAVSINLEDEVEENIVRCEALQKITKKGMPKTKVSINELTVLFETHWPLMQDEGDVNREVSETVVEIPVLLNDILNGAKHIASIREHDAELSGLDLPLTIYFFTEKDKKICVLEDQKFEYEQRPYRFWMEIDNWKITK